MQDILREIYTEFYVEKTSGRPLDRNGQELWDKAQEILGYDMLDEMICAQNRTTSEEFYDTFRLGFRAGALLMLELVQP